jgi:hypothetical protein
MSAFTVKDSLSLSLEESLVIRSFLSVLDQKLGLAGMI